MLPFRACAGGALGALFVGLVASNAWEKGFPKWGSLGTSFAFSPERESGRQSMSSASYILAISSVLVFALPCICSSF